MNTLENISLTITAFTSGSIMNTYSAVALAVSNVVLIDQESGK